MVGRKALCYELLMPETIYSMPRLIYGQIIFKHTSGNQITVALYDSYDMASRFGHSLTRSHLAFRHRRLARPKHSSLMHLQGETSERVSRAHLRKVLAQGHELRSALVLQRALGVLTPALQPLCADSDLCWVMDQGTAALQLGSAFACPAERMRCLKNG